MGLSKQRIMSRAGTIRIYMPRLNEYMWIKISQCKWMVNLEIYSQELWDDLIAKGLNFEEWSKNNFDNVIINKSK